MGEGNGRGGNARRPQARSGSVRRAWERSFRGGRGSRRGPVPRFGTVYVRRLGRLPRHDNGKRGRGQVRSQLTVTIEESRHLRSPVREPIAQIVRSGRQCVLGAKDQLFGEQFKHILRPLAQFRIAIQELFNSWPPAICRRDRSWS